MKWILPMLIIVCIEIAKLYPTYIEKWYSSTIYPIIVIPFRWFTSIFSFSIGDCLYILLLSAIIMLVVLAIVGLIFPSKVKINWGRVLYHILLGLAWLYIYFQLIWGLNYYRLGIAYQLNIKDNPYSTELICTLTDTIIHQMNYYRSCINTNSVIPEKTSPIIINNAIKDYQTAQQTFQFLTYNHPSIKLSMISHAGKYLGFTGYYNPFSTEAQVRGEIPKTIIPFIVTHEIAHQIGYASEDEANFVAYLVAIHSNNLYLKYAMYIEMYQYAKSELFERNTFASGVEKLNPNVIRDLKAIRNFFVKEQNSITPSASIVYDAYLKANNQSAGIESYNNVLAWVINYQQKQSKSYEQ